MIEQHVIASGGKTKRKGTIADFMGIGAERLRRVPASGG